MTRLEKKCFFASAGAHAAFALLLCLAPLMLATHPEEVVLPVLTLIPSRLTDGPNSGGGSPAAKSTAPPAPAAGPVVQPQLFVAPPPPKTQPAPPKPEKRVAMTEPEAPPTLRSHRRAEPVVSDKPVPKDDEGEESNNAKPSKKHEIPISLKRETSKTSEKTSEESDSQERVASETHAARARYAAMVKAITSRIGQGVSAGTAIDIPGPGGEVTGSYKQFVEMAYKAAWNQPPELTDQSAKVKARVTIARDGTVISFEIVKPSGHADMDKSVDRLKSIRSIGTGFPEGDKRATQSFTITFDLKPETE